ncbi:hypothetical protein MMYC01_204091 [Madurella mycetomatis]|uniref:Uncharacterized protein n=1 Tax=Madurella mycetomatis TaxID=100816 RepID=A0A175WBI1_9PEZI|nr:hypothetical protein MMYC01_204803 [Madurella mycetomatis]KXX81108.1 hypothetical protein MMYC01_204091 [Madurella mycetomatis]
MPLPTSLRPLLASKRFWSDYFFITDVADPSPYSPHFEDVTLTFSFGRNPQAQYSLSTSFDSSFSYIPLSFSTPSLREREIAHDDQAHWHPHVLRWEELELICRAVAAADEGYPHPGIPLLFLYRFAPICAGDDVDRIVGMLGSAWKKVLGPGAEREVRRFVERADYTSRGYRWFFEGESDGGYWWIGQGEDAESAAASDDVYTRRWKGAVEKGGWENAAWNELVDEARRVVEGLADGGWDGDAEEGTGLTLTLREHYRLDLWLALTENDRPMHQRAGRYLQLTLKDLLRIFDLGDAGPSGASSTLIDGRSVYTSDHSWVVIWGGLPRGRAIIKQMLWWLVAPLATTLRNGTNYKTLQFNLADEDEDQTEESYLGICVPQILPDCDWLVSHTLPHSLQTTLVSLDVLGDTGKVTGPNEDGWLTVTTADGGELAFNLGRADEAEVKGTGALALRKIKPQASALLHRFMEASGAVLSPVALAAKPLPDRISSEWVHHRVIDAETLHGVLSAGAFEMWVNAERKARDESDDDKW